MSNKDAVNAYYDRMRQKSFRTKSFLVHENDLEKVEKFVAKLKKERLKAMLISPIDTLSRLKKLKLSDDQFSRIHHMGNQTSKRHAQYLSGIERYQESSKNYDVAQRIKCISDYTEEDIEIDQAIKLCLKTFPF